MPRVLVVDDDPDLVAVCSLVLESEGYQIGVARNGLEAYDRLARDDVDVVLMDVMMPVMDGLTVCRLAKRDPKTRDVPIIIMSASDRLCEQGRTCPADAVIAKPFDMDLLLDTISQFAGPE